MLSYKADYSKRKEMPSKTTGYLAKSRENQSKWACSPTAAENNPKMLYSFMPNMP